MVVAKIQRRQADGPRTQAQRLAEHDELMERTERNLAEATEKLNALINVVGGAIRKRPPESTVS